MHVYIRVKYRDYEGFISWVVKFNQSQLGLSIGAINKMFVR